MKSRVARLGLLAIVRVRYRPLYDQFLRIAKTFVLDPTVSEAANCSSLQVNGIRGCLVVGKSPLYAGDLHFRFWGDHAGAVRAGKRRNAD